MRLKALAITFIVLGSTFPMLGCSHPAAAPVPAQTASEDLESMSAKVPADRTLNDFEKRMTFDFFVMMATSQAKQWNPHSQLMLASSDSVDPTSRRTEFGSYRCYFKTGLMSGLVVSVTGNQIKYRKRHLDIFLTDFANNAAPIDYRLLPSHYAMSRALETGKVKGPNYGLVLLRQSNAIDPIYYVSGTGFWDSPVAVNAATGALLTPQPDADGDKLQKLTASLAQDDSEQ